MDNDGSHHGASPGPPKMVIPRLNRQVPPPKPKPEIQRVGKACVNCRKRKVKCTGEIPYCRQCENSGVACSYEPHRKDRLKTQTDRNRNLVMLLRDLSMRVSVEDKGKITRMLEGADFSHEGDQAASTTSRDDEETPSGAQSYERVDDDDRNQRRGSIGPSISDEYTRILSTTETSPPCHELEDPARPGGPSGTLAEDLLRSQSSRETGYVGSMSEIHWLRIFLNQTQPARLGTIASVRNTLPQHTESFSYYLDDLSVELEIFIDPHELPDARTARNFFSCYTRTVHRAFPILPTAFEEQFEKLCTSIEVGHPIQAPNAWKALLNLVFAIGAAFSHLIEAEWQGHHDDHKIYLSRASQLLGIKNTILLLSAPDGTMIQALGLLSFYFLAIGHVGRAWSMIGMSLRSALSVGLHLRNGDTSVELEKRQALVRTWWGLHSVESALSSITGRPSVMANEHIAVPLPHNLSSGQSQGIPGKLPFLDAHIMIGLITQDVLTHLYSQRMEVSTSGQMQVVIASLMTTLNSWARQALPRGFSVAEYASDVNMERDRQIFIFYYYKTKILITRPCFQRLNAHNSNRSGETPEIIQRMAEDCVRAALDMTSMLPDSPNPRWIYETGPWWSIIHSIMQALTVLILEITYGKSSRDDDLTAAELSIIKLLRWLKCMRAKNGVAKRAYDLMSSILLDADPSTPNSIRQFLFEDKPERIPNTAMQFRYGFPQYDHTSQWTSSFGPESVSTIQGQDHLGYTLSPPPFSALGSAQAGATENLFPVDMPFVGPGSGDVMATEFPFPLQPVAVLDFLADPWSSEQADPLHPDPSHRQ